MRLFERAELPERSGLGCCLLCFLSKGTRHSRQRKELAQKPIGPGSPVGQLQSPMPLEGRMASPVISDLGTHGHSAYNNDSHLPKPWSLASSSFNPHPLELVIRVFQPGKQPLKNQIRSAPEEWAEGQLEARLSDFKSSTLSAAAPFPDQ